MRMLLWFHSVGRLADVELGRSDICRGNAFVFYDLHGFVSVVVVVVAAAQWETNVILYSVTSSNIAVVVDYYLSRIVLCVWGRYVSERKTRILCGGFIWY